MADTQKKTSTVNTPPTTAGGELQPLTETQTPDINTGVAQTAPTPVNPVELPPATPDPTEPPTQTEPVKEEPVPEVPAEPVPEVVKEDLVASAESVSQAAVEPTESTAKAQTEEEIRQSELFRNELPILKAELTSEFQKQAKLNGQEFDVTNPEFVQAINRLEIEGVYNGYIVNGEEYKEQFNRIASLFLSDIKAETETKLSSEEILNSKLEIINGYKNADGSMIINLQDDLEVKLLPNGQIDYNNIDPTRLNLSELERLQNLLSEEYAGDRFKARDAILKEASQRTQRQSDALLDQLNDVYTNLEDRAELERRRTDDALEIQKEQLRMQKAATLNDIKEAQNDSLEYAKMRLHAMGADDSINGLMSITKTELKFAKELARTSENYDFQMNNIAIEQANLNEAFVQTIAEITTDHAGALLDLNNNLENSLAKIDEAKLLNLEERDTYIINSRLNHINNIKQLKKEAAAAAAEAAEIRRKEGFTLATEAVTNAGYLPIVNATGEVEALKDDNGNLIPSLDGIQLNNTIERQLNAEDLALSKSLGYYVKDGKMLINPETGNPIPIMAREEFSFDKAYKTAQQALDRELGLGNLSVSEYNAKTNALDKAFDLIQSSTGEYIYSLNPSFQSLFGTDGAGSDAQRFVEKAVQDGISPNLNRTQCGAFCNDILVKLGEQKRFGDSLQQKIDVSNYTVEEFIANPKEGFAVLDNKTWTGHVAFITMDADGSMLITDSNQNGKGRINQRKMTQEEFSTIKKFYIPEVLNQKKPEITNFNDPTTVIGTGVYGPISGSSSSSGTGDSNLTLDEMKGIVDAISLLDESAEPNSPQQLYVENVISGFNAAQKQEMTKQAGIRLMKSNQEKDLAKKKVAFINGMLKIFRKFPQLAPYMPNDLEIDEIIKKPFLYKSVPSSSGDSFDELFGE